MFAIIAKQQLHNDDNYYKNDDDDDVNDVTVALTNIVLRALVSGGCLLPCCPVQCLLHYWTNHLND